MKANKLRILRPRQGAFLLILLGVVLDIWVFLPRIVEETLFARIISGIILFVITAIIGLFIGGLLGRLWFMVFDDV